MVTKSSTTEIPLSLNASLTLVQNLGNELGYELKEKDDTHIVWKVKGNLFRSAYELEVRLKAANENNTEVEVVAKHWALADGAGILTAGVDDFLRRVREKAGLSVVTAADETPKRGGCLTAFLILAMIGNAVLALFQWFSIQNLYVDDKPLAFLGGAFNAVALVFAIAIWKGKQWGVYGYVGSMGLLILLNLATGQILPALQGLVPIALLIGLLQPVWKHFYKQQSLSLGERSIILFLVFVILAVIGVFPYELKFVSLPIFIALYLVIFMMICGTTFLLTRYVSASPLVWFIPFTAWLIAEVVFMVLLRWSGDVVSVMLRQLKYLFESGFGILDDFALPWSASFITWTSGGLIGGLGGRFASKLMRRR